jgi:hypothetical protein
MAWSLTQSNTVDINTVASDGLAFGSNNDTGSDGNHVIAVMGRFGNSGATFTCSDSAGNTYVPGTAQASNSWQINSGGSNTDCAFGFYALNIKSNVANTVTVTAATGGSHRFTFCVAEWAPGAGTTVSFNAGPLTTTFTSGTGQGAGPLTTTAANGLVINWIEVDAVTSSFTTNSPWLALANTSNLGFAGTGRCFGQYQLGVAAGSYTGNTTLGASNSGAGIIMAFTATTSTNVVYEDDSFNPSTNALLVAAAEPVVTIYS